MPGLPPKSDFGARHPPAEKCFAAARGGAGLEVPRAGTNSPCTSLLFLEGHLQAAQRSVPSLCSSQCQIHLGVKGGLGRDGMGWDTQGDISFLFSFLLQEAHRFPLHFTQEPSSCPWAGWLIVQPQHVPSPSVTLLLTPLVWSEEGDIHLCFPSESLVPVPPSPTSSFRLSMRQGASQSIWIPSVTSCVAAGNSPHFLVSPITQLHNGATWA